MNIFLLITDVCFQKLLLGGWPIINTKRNFFTGTHPPYIIVTDTLKIDFVVYTVGHIFDRVYM